MSLPLNGAVAPRQTGAFGGLLEGMFDLLDRLAGGLDDVIAAPEL